MNSVSFGGTHIASYIYDESEQRISKATGSDLIHYHYDLEGRLISETDGHTGATLREYIWLGLTPLAVIVTEEVTTEPGNCEGGGTETGPNILSGTYYLRCISPYAQ